MKYILTVDFGTSAIKAAIFDQNGDAVFSKASEYPLLYGSEGVIEVELDTLELAFKEAVTACTSFALIDTRDIVSIGFSSSGETMLFLDENGNSLRNGITWMDTRASEEVQRLTTYFGVEAIYKATGQANIEIYYPAPKLLWLMTHEADRMSRLWKVMFMKDYFIYRLTGKCVCDDSVLCTTTFWDINKRSYWNEMLEKIGISVFKLPQIVSQGSNIGKINRASAFEYGLNENTIVNVGAQDQMCGALGAGNIRGGILSESLGSAMMVMATLDQFKLNEDELISCSPSAIAGKYMVNGYSTGAISMRWFRDQFCQKELSREKELGQNVYDFIDEQVNRIPIGADGLLMLPFLQGTGMPEPNDNARGVYFGITTRHGKYYFARALMEGISMSLRRIIEGMDEKLGISAKEIICFSGGAKSRVWMQMQADVTGLPIKITKNSENTACFGAAILAGVACGVWKNVEDAVSHIKFADVYQPDPRNAGEYRKLYGKFKELRGAVEYLF